jgi:hypothetical protein
MNSFEPTNFKNDSISYLTPSWDELNLLTFQVSNQIKQQDQKFNRIVTLAKGGWPMTRSLSDFLDIDQIASIGIKFYCGLNQRLNKPEIYQELPVEVRGEQLLLFDDVADTGESLVFTIGHLMDKGAKEVKTASLFYKPHSKIKPNFFGAQTDSWIIFPFEHCEMVKTLHEKWLKNNLSIVEITKRFEKLGFSKDIINSALNN